jgi:putative FmdB family regulatory protein
MPIYKYRCEACDAVSEYFIGVGDDEKIHCKVCGGSAMKRAHLTYFATGVLISVSFFHIIPKGQSRA